MGVSIPDVRMVVHFGAPSHTMNWAQEAGRCSRDGKPGVAIILGFPHSLTPRMCSDDMRAIFQAREQQCIRRRLLEDLCACVDGLTVEDPDGTTCSDCADTCCCRACSCCSFCSSRCTCPMAFHKQMQPECWLGKLI